MGMFKGMGAKDVRALADKYDRPLAVSDNGEAADHAAEVMPFGDDAAPVLRSLEVRPMPPPMDVGEELPDLNPREYAFVLAICEGLTAVEAYRRSYTCETWTPHMIAVEAYKLRHRPRIALWLRAVRIAGVANAAVTVENHLRQLERIREAALSQGDAKAAVAAEHLRGKVSGFYIERHETIVHSDPATLLLKLATIAPEAANALARRFGMPLPATIPDRSADALTIDAASG